MYYITLYPTVVGGDHSEFVVASCQLSVPHPPGYPLLSLLGYGFIHLFPLSGEYSSWLTNILSAIFGLFSVFFIYEIIFLLTDGNYYSSFFGSGLYAFNYLIWTESIQFEVFSLNNMFCTLILYLVVEVEYQRSNKFIDQGIFKIII